MQGGVQLVGGSNQVITSGGQIITSASPQLIPGTQLLQAHGSTQVLPTGQILPGGQVLHNGQVIQGGQVFHGPHLLSGGSLLQGGQVIQGGQVLQGGQLIPSGQVINSSQLITTTTQMATTGVSGLGAGSTPLYVTPSTPVQQQQPHTVTLHQSVQQPPTPTASPFSVLSKSPGAALPRTSPSPSPYHPTTPSPHPSVQSPAPYTTRSPAPSPHSNVSAMRSPAPPTPSPAATPTPQAHSSIATIGQQQSAGMVQGVMSNVGMVQSLVPQLPLSQVVGSNGMVLPQPGVQQTATGVKQVVSGGQLIQIVSSPQPTQPRQPVATPTPKPIQPKQPQLLPKPPQAAVVGQPAAPPPGKTLMNTRPVTPGGQQPIVIGAAGQQQAMMAGQQGLGGFVINPSLLQSSLQQPFLIQQPNGVLLVRPSGHTGAGGAPGQALLVPMPGQHQMMSAGGKTGQHQTVVFSGNGQGGPAYVIPQNGSAGLGAQGVMGTAQGSRGPQPIIRLVAPQAPLQLQQIQTPNGPTFVAIPAGQTVNLQSLLAAGGATMRTLAPQMTSGPLQLAPSSVAPNMGPVVSMGHIQMSGGGQQLQVSVPGAPLQLASSLPSSLPSVITTTKQTVIDEAVAPASMVTATESGTHHQTLTDSNKNTKKKSKKKKREREPKDEKLKGKGTSINLNDILKETGIVGDLMLFDENELGLGGEGMEGVQVAAPTQLTQVPAAAQMVSPAPAATQLPSLPAHDTNAGFATSENAGHIVVGSSHQHPLLGMGNSLMTGTVVTSSAPTGLMTSASMPSGMSITLDPSCKFFLGSDPTKPHLTTPNQTPSQMGGLMIPSCQSQVQVIGGASMGMTTSLCNVANSGSMVNVMSSSMPALMTGSSGAGVVGTNTLPTVCSLPSFTQLLTPPTQVTSNLVNHGPSVTGKTKPLQLQQTASKLTQVTTKNLMGADISKVAQNTHLLQTLHLPTAEKPCPTPSGQPLLTSLLSGQQASCSNSGEQHGGFPLQVSVADGGPVLTVVTVGAVMSLPECVVSTGTTFSSPATPLSILVPSQASQVPQSSAVIASSSATNNVVSGAIISHKQFASNSALIPQTSVTYTNTENVPVSRGHSQIVNALQDNVPSQTSNTSSFVAKNIEGINKTNSFQNEYVATLQRGQNIIDTNKNKSKSNKKKKKDKEIETFSTPTTSTVMVKQSLQERLKSSTCSSTTGTPQQLCLAPIPNGLNGPAIKTASQSVGSSTPPGSLPITLGESGVQTDNTSLVGPYISTAPPVSIIPSIITTTTTMVQAPTMATTATITTTTASSPHTPTGVVFPGPKQQFKQVKHLILSPQNQEALKKVHSQIQVLQNKKTDQDAAGLQQLYAECRKIVATGKHVTVTTTPQQPQIAPTPSQPTPVRYSHPVGHKFITLTQFKQIKHLPQDQQRQIMDQSKQVMQRWKDPGTVSSTGTSTVSAIHTPAPHLSPSPQVSVSGGPAKGSVSPVSGASMPTIATSASSPTVPTTSTTVSSCSTTNTLNYSTKMTPPQCSPVSSTTPAISHTNTLGPSPKSLVVLPPQASPHPSSTSGAQEQSPGQTKAPLAFSITKEQLFEHQLKTDQNGALNPDYRNPFKNKIDACKRLIRYHVFSECVPSPHEVAETTTQFELQAESLLKKFNNMKYKYQSLLIKDSMRRHASSETVMLYRLLVQEDKTNIEREKADVQSGKIIDLPTVPPCRASEESSPLDTPYPWELEWENQKIYKFEPWKNKEEEGEEEEGEEDEEEEGVEEEEEEQQKEEEAIVKEEMKDNIKDIKLVIGDKVDVKLKEEEEVVVKEEGNQEIKRERREDKGEETQGKAEKEESSKNPTKPDEDDEFDDGQEGDPCLHIFVEDEEEEEEEEKVKEEEEKKHHMSPAAKLDCDDAKSNSDDRDSSKKESEQEEELVICDSEVVSTSIQNSPVNKEETTVLNYSSESPWTTSCGESLLNRLSNRSQSPDIRRTPCSISKPIISSNFETSGNNSYKQIHSPSLKLVTDRTDKDKRKERVEREYKKKSVRGKDKDKERGRDREKEDRPPKKLKIKLKSEERALVPPLRIRTEDRGSGLKLTLKKQEGSGAYYSVGEERKREYRVEQNEDEEEDEEADDIVGRLCDGEEEEEEDGDGKEHDLKEVKVVLQDVCKDERFKKQIEERSSKKRRRDKGDDRSDRNEKGDRYNSHWSNYSQQLHQSEGDKNFSQSSNHENRTWNCNSGMEWRRSGGEGASSVDNSSERRTREYSPRLYSYNDHYGHEYSSRHNHSQPYGHSGSQSRNSHSYY
ncbi:mucin-17-like [Homarus americanus]|nr:mucin-17-like [Homarus americanus]